MNNVNLREGLNAHIETAADALQEQITLAGEDIMQTVDDAFENMLVQVRSEYAQLRAYVANRLGVGVGHLAAGSPAPSQPAEPVMADSADILPPASAVAEFADGSG